MDLYTNFTAKKAMGFWNQLWLLLWKNFTLHKRQKVRIIVELIWPLLLFLILMWVRTRGLKLYVHQCYFDEKAMPSAGFLPFLQNTLCTFNNTCHPYFSNEDVRNEVIRINSSIIETFIYDLEYILNNEAKFIKKNFNKLNTDLETLSLFTKKLTDHSVPLIGSFALKTFLKNPKNVQETIQSQNLSLNSDVVDLLLNKKILLQGIQKVIDKGYKESHSYLCEGDGFRHLFRLSNSTKAKVIQQQVCNLDSDELSILFSAIIKEINGTAIFVELSNITAKHVGRKLVFENWKQVVKDGEVILLKATQLNSLNILVNQTESSLENLKEIIDFDNENNTVKLIQFAVCGRNTSTFFDPETQGPVRHIEELKEQMKKDREGFGQNRAEYVYSYDNTTTPKCNALFSSLEQNEITRMIWKQVKPFVRGKILFAPNNPATERIMKRVNHSFIPIESFRNLSILWLENYQFVLAKFMKDNTPIFKILKSATFQENFLLKILQKLSSSSESWTSIRMLSSVENLYWFLDTILERWEEWLEQFNKVVEEVRDYLECFDLDRFEGYDTEDDIVTKGLELISENKLWAGIFFMNMERKKDDTLPPYIRYKIRMDANKVDSTKKVEDRLPRPGPRRRPAIDLKYLTYGFAFLQDIIEHSIIQEHTGSNRSTGVYLQQFPYPCHIYDQFIMALSRSFPMFMVLSWVYTCSMIIKSIVYEKEQRLKEVMKAMGLSNGVLWLAWFIKSFILMAMSCALLTIILVYGNVLENSDPAVVYLFLLCYTVATIMKGFLISTFFSRANIAAAAGGLIFFILYLPYPFLVLWEERLSVHQKAGSSLLSNVAFGFGCSYFAHYEEDGIGINWSNFATSTMSGDKFSLAHCMGMLILDSIIYGILTWYIEAVFPGQYGVPKPWYFFITKSYWCGTIRACDNPDCDEERPYISCGSNYEAEPTDLPLGVSIRNLTKIYDNQKLAVDDLSLNFYENQITSFLGHNGAGKTTTISILTGMFPPTKGTAKIYGADIRTDIDIVRRSLGTCPQHNVLFDQLTTQEHLWFYARLKGASEKDVMEETEQMIKDTRLMSKKNELSKNLSGGMQRKLSIAIAFVGGSKTVILDEPTAGVDPYARRSIWELLLKYKKGRTVILTTHHMDEADLLGDRIAVIANGKLLCCGSSLFLKTCFGNGYYLTLVKANDYIVGDGDFRNNRSISTDNGSKMSNENADEGVADMSTIDSRSDYSDSTAVADAASSTFIPWGGLCIVSKVTAFIQAFVPDAHLVEDVGTELSYLLPLSAQREGVLERLFEALDSKLKDLHIASYGISETTLEEIFLKVTSDANDKTKEEECSESITGNHIDSNNQYNNIKGINLTIEEFNCCQSLRNFSIFKSHQENKTKSISNADDSAVRQRLTDGVNNDQNQDPVLPPPTIAASKKFTGTSLIRRQLAALHIRRFHHSRRNYKGLCCEIVLPALFVCLALLLTLAIPPMMDEPPLELNPWLYDPPNYVFFSNEDSRNPITRKYVDTLLSPPGLGDRCVEAKSHKRLPCEPLPFNRSELLPTYNFSLANRVIQCKCEIGTMQCPAGLPPDPPQVQTTATDILLNATGRNISDWIMKTWRKYHKKRYGGFTFGFKDPISKVDFTLAHNAVDRLTSGWIQDTQKDTIHNILNMIEGKIHSIGMSDNVKVWFNNRGWAASVGYMNALNNILLRANLPPGQNHKYYGISVINHPMNFTQGQLQVEVLERSGLSLLHAVCVIFAMSFVTASFVMFLIEDRITGSKHLQFVSGVKPFIYWIGAYTWDLCNYLVPAALIIIIFVIFREEAYVSRNNISGLVLLLFLYGWASIPLIYPASYVFSVPSSAFVALACLNLFIGIVSTLSTYVLELFNDDELLTIAGILRKVFLIFPHYCLGRGLMDMFTNQLTVEMLARFGIQTFRYPLDWDFLGKNIMCLTIQGAVFFIFTLLVEYKFFFRKSLNMPNFIPDAEEDDVAMERSRVLSGHTNNAVLRMENLTKIYKSGQHPAVNHLCMAVQAGECFGLLGVNGAGKTTTFKMLTGNTSITGGNAYISGHSIKTDIDKARQNIGYCPQFDALDSLLTGWEHLEFYARLRGIPEKYVQKVASWGIQKLGLTSYATRCAGTYSGGNKRKLSTALALIGNPSVIFLDEPTTGMDPKARRFLWNCIIDLVKEGHSVILTSHSMEECEALCTRLAIMVNGQFRCLGSIQHLKNKYGAGYTLTLRVGGELSNMREVASYIEKTFGSMAVLQEQHLNQMEYQLAPTLSLSHVFKELKNATRLLKIEDYSISQTTLDQVFISFAKMQADVSEELPQTTFQCIFKNGVTLNKKKKSGQGNNKITQQAGDIELFIRRPNPNIPPELV
ncbi:phospholipid-transporting ATPase ABCA1-like isoform X3 [Centruroides vittatus]|uniref:phospholipid-transporting ATPase ABCA1-like isoform X3 n=1 Tax=Centruroides vittatus TaxID=120091 RepID=UPI00350E990C